MRLRSVLSLCALILAVGCKHATPADEDASPENVKVDTVVAATKTVRETLAMDGQFVVAEGNSAKLAPTAAGKVQTVFVKEGDRVHKGQKLATLDVRVQSEQANSAISARAAALAQARQSQASLKAAQADQASQVRIAESALFTAIAERDSDVRQAELELQRIQAGARPEEIAQAGQAVTQAQIGRDKARADRDRDAKLSKEGYVSGQQADASEATYRFAESSLKQVQAQLSLLRKGARREERLAAEEKLKSARTVGDQKVEQARLTLRQAQEGRLALDAKAAEAEAANLNAGQKSADARAAVATQQTGEIRAPYDGFITRRFLGPGDSADGSNPVLEIAADGYAIDFVGQLSTSDAAKVHEGMTVNFSEEGVHGRIVSVGVAGAGGLVPTRVRVTASRLVPGAFESAKVVIRTLNGAVAIPKDCVVTRDGKSTAFLVAEGKAKLTEVKPGPVDGDSIAIFEGIKAGQTVILVGQYELADGTTVEVDKK